jgi:methyltransferase (TIGR00027 family)
MEADRSSTTAEFTAAMRADHLLNDADPVLDDRWALHLIAPEMRKSVEAGAFHAFLESSAWRPTQGHIVMRARFADDALAAAAEDGVRQLVVLAAGLDSSCLRRDPRVRAIEVDHPASQRTKRERLAALGVPLDGIEFAAVDFGREDLRDALARTSLDTARPAFVSWLGVSMYLSRATALETIQQIRSSVAEQSELVFDYPIPFEQLDPEYQEIARLKIARLASSAEPRTDTTYTADEMKRALAERGFAVCEDVGPAELDRHYCAGRSDGLRANPEFRIAHARAV